MNPAFAVLSLLIAAGPLAAAEATNDAKGPHYAEDAVLLKERGIEPTATGAVAYLTSLQPDPEVDKKAAGWIAQLGDARFAVRQAATQGLLELPRPPVEALQAATKSPDSETATRARQILAHPKTIAKLASLARQRDVTAAVLRTIGQQALAGTTEVLLDVAPLLEDVELAMLAGDAAARAAQAEELPTLRKSLDSDCVAVRFVAVRGMGKAGGTAVLDELAKLDAKESPQLRLAVACTLAEHGDPRCLPDLIRSIASDDTAVRTGAEQVLRAATGENFGFNPFADPKDQIDAAKKWRTWLAAHGDTAKLRTPLVLEPLPEDLRSGLVLHYAFDRDAGPKFQDASGQGRHATGANSIAYVVRGKGQAIEFTGAGHHGADGGHATLPAIDFAKLDQFSVALWVRETGMSHEEGEAYITFGVDRGSGTEDSLGIAHFNGSLIYRVGEGQIALPYKPADRGRWVHYAMTFEAGRLRAYHDAKEVGDVKARVNVPSRQAALARHWWAGGEGTSARFQGAMDDVRVYDRALSAEQIRLLMEDAK